MLKLSYQYMQPINVYFGYFCSLPQDQLFVLIVWQMLIPRLVFKDSLLPGDIWTVFGFLKKICFGKYEYVTTEEQSFSPRLSMSENLQHVLTSAFSHTP
jgi:hypothetical protein